MSDNKEFIEFYNQTRENHVRMHTWDINGLSVWYVSGFGKREATTVLDCRDFAAITTKGCIIITDDHGVWLKINDQNWTEPATGEDRVVHDLDILKFITIESDESHHVAVIVDPGAQS
ncbi:MAG: hypothetical protein HXN12_00270 [Porphyromonadaceae bacterium]|nr:hypothetical protein [Porphyromonadaceae bacterium]